MKAIYKSVALLFGAMSLFSSCEDFLTRDPQDSYLLEEFLNTDAKVDDYTTQIYGPLTWNGFDDKFSWCVGELYSGNVYHNYADEGQFHFMEFTNNNSHIANGYTSLYSVIAKCNHIINDVPAIAEKNGVSQDIIRKVVGEAKMFRGMAYFYLAEYWGATPIVLDNNKDVANDFAPQITKADRKSLYTLIEKDWMEALSLLPSDRQPDFRVYKASAAGMLTKLYVTMASCQADLDEPGSYKCDNPDYYYGKALEFADTTFKYAGKELDYGFDEMFQPGSTSSEILFALRFEQGVYAQGCSRQIQFARSKKLAAGGDAYGGEKGLTFSLLKSFEVSDARLRATSYYFGTNAGISEYKGSESASDLSDIDVYDGKTDLAYTLNDGSKYYYFLNPGKSLKPTEDREELAPIYGNEPMSAVFNHCRKFVYSVKPLDSPFSIDLTIPLLRLSDVYLLAAEAKMGINASDVEKETEEGIEYVNTVRARAGLPAITKIAFCMPDEYVEKMYTGKAVVDDPDGKQVSIEASCESWNLTYDLMLERRHEFALENQNWLDIKRLYYRDPAKAVQYIKEQDRSCTFGEKYQATKKDDRGNLSSYQRQYIINALSAKAHDINSAQKEQAKEGKINYDNLTFFLPVPASVPQTASLSQVNDYSEQIKNGEYPY
ncbi:MAG: RagB/SusD family nutrient uptake outer membrane protein [Paludibacteraceae bacterium]|nr:RagB/SusD family nutrient uptake outer membrane protein [Paludibacteraceae bacterium]